MPNELVPRDRTQMKGRKIYPPPGYDTHILIDPQMSVEMDLLALLNKNGLKVGQSARITTSVKSGKVIEPGLDLIVLRIKGGVQPLYSYNTQLSAQEIESERQR